MRDLSTIPTVQLEATAISIRDALDLLSDLPDSLVNVDKRVILQHGLREIEAEIDRRIGMPVIQRENRGVS